MSNLIPLHLLDITQVLHQLFVRVVSRQWARLAALLDGAVVGPIGDGVDPRGAEGMVGRVAPLETLRLDLSVVVEIGKLAPLPLYGQAIFWTVIVGQCPFVSLEGPFVLPYRHCCRRYPKLPPWAAK